MAYINKKTREEVWEKYGRKCSYCGKDLEYKQLQVDHIKPYWHNLVKEGKDFKRRNKAQTIKPSSLIYLKLNLISKHHSWQD